MDIVERIKEKCKETNTNLASLEKELNIGNGVIRRWNERKASAEQVHKVAIRLNATVEWLLTGKEAGEPMTEDEQQLLNYYRISDDRGKRNILRTAQAESGEETSSISGNG